MREICRGELRAPAAVVEVEITHPGEYQPIGASETRSVWCLVRRDGVPQAIRFYDVAADAVIDRERIRESSRDLASVPVPATLPAVGSLTVAVCTRDRSAGLRTTMASLMDQSDPSFDVLVVDNSADGNAKFVIDEFPQLDVTYVHEPAPGLSRARNCAVRELRADFVAWIDDDELADPDWIRWLRIGFAHDSRPAAVTGMMSPAALTTQAQADFERYGGFHRGRGVAPTVLAADRPTVFNPLYPLPNFGAGGNMAFRVADLRAAGAFDENLGAGTLTHGGEETKVLSALLDQGKTVLFWPAAVTWHYHRETGEALVKQFYGYSAGLTAFYMSLVLTSPKYLFRIAALVPRGVVRMLTNSRAGQDTSPPPDFPPELLRAGRRGLLSGAWLYLRQRFGKG